MGRPYRRDLLGRHGRAAPGVPARLAVGAPDQVPGQRLGPLGLDPRHRPAPTAGRSPPARRPSPRPAGSGPARSRGRWRNWLRGPRRTRPARAAGRGPSGRGSAFFSTAFMPMCDSRPASSDMCTRSASPAAIPGLARRDVAARARHRPPRRPGRLDDDAQVAGGLAELAVHVLPLADPQVVQVLAAAHPAERRRGQLALLVAQVVPQRHEGQEVRARLGEPGVLGVGRVPRVGGPLARVLDGQRRRDDQHLAAQPCWPASRIIRPSRGSSGRSGQLAAGVGELRGGREALA